jgi:hypothetical protein
MNMSDTMMSQVTYDIEVEKQGDLEQSPQFFVNADLTASREKSIDLESIMAIFLSQHQMFWNDITDTMKEFQSLSLTLLNKKS